MKVWQWLKKFSADVRDYQELFFVEEQISGLKKKLQQEGDPALELELEMYINSSREIQNRINARGSQHQRERVTAQ